MTKVFTEPAIVTIKFTLRSCAVAPNSTYFVPASSVISASPTNVITGAIVSITVTFLTALEIYVPSVTE